MRGAPAIIQDAHAVFRGGINERLSNPCDTRHIGFDDIQRRRDSNRGVECIAMFKEHANPGQARQGMCAGNHSPGARHRGPMYRSGGCKSHGFSSLTRMPPARDQRGACGTVAVVMRERTSAVEFISRRPALIPNPRQGQGSGASSTPVYAEDRLWRVASQCPFPSLVCARQPRFCLTTQVDHGFLYDSRTTATGSVSHCRTDPP